MFELDFLTVVNFALLVYLLICCIKVSKWIRVHEPWLADHHARNGRLEKAVCQLEQYAYRNPIDPNLAPPAAERFCVKPMTPPDGWGGDAPPDGF